MNVTDPYVPTIPRHPDPQNLGFGEIWFGTIAPASSIGNVGDFYVNINNDAVYVKGSNGIWTNVATAGGGGGAPVGSAGTFQGGVVAVPNNSTGAAVTGLALPGVPVTFLLSLIQPSGGFNIAADLVDGSAGAGGFTYSLTGQTDSASYKLAWIAVF